MDAEIQRRSYLRIWTAGGMIYTRERRLSWRDLPQCRYRHCRSVVNTHGIEPGLPWGVARDRSPETCHVIFARRTKATQAMYV